MTKTFSNYYAKSKKRPKIRSFFLVMLWLILAAAILLSGNFFANLLTGSGFNIGSGKLKISGTKFYAIYFGEFDNESDAKQCAVWVENSGGAGYLYKSDKYYVLARPYGTLDDANKVAANLGATKYDASVKTFEVKDKRVSIKDLSTADRRVLVTKIAKIDEIICLIDKVDEEVDRNALTNIAASNAINSYKTTIKALRNEISELALKYQNSKLNSLVAYLNLFEDRLDLAVSKLLVSTNQACVIKYLLCEIRLNYYSMLLEM